MKNRKINEKEKMKSQKDKNTIKGELGILIVEK